MATIRRIAMWIVWHVPCGRLAPKLMAFALGGCKYERK